MARLCDCCFWDEKCRTPEYARERMTWCPQHKYSASQEKKNEEAYQRSLKEGKK